MEVPTTLRALWAQRRRWARGQGEVLHVHWRVVMRWSNRRLWPIALESFASLLWILALVAALILATLALITGRGVTIFGYGLAWGIAIAVVGLLQLAFALGVEWRNDRLAVLVYALGPIYPLAYWLISASASVRAELPALLSGPRRERVVWDIPRESVEAGPKA
jgi:biofilm PGA synthesis N-glycosyltransferase PgaC